MTKIKILFAGLSAALISSVVLISPAAAAVQEPQSIHTWVSRTGAGTACTFAAPCASFALAHKVTIPGGVISALDAGDYGSVTITKSITIRAEGVDGGATDQTNVDFFIDVQAGATAVVVLDGLHLNGGSGVLFSSGGQLQVVRCVITSGVLAGTAGIKFAPNSPSRLSVIDTVIGNEGNGTGGGIVVNPQAGGSAQVALERVSVSGGAFGIAVDGTGSTAGINMTIADSLIANNTKDGIIATTPSGGAPIGVLVTNTKSVNNAFGIRSIGAGVTVRVDNSKIAGNVTGLSFSGGGALQSYGNNSVDANATNGAFSGPIPLK